MRLFPGLVLCAAALSGCSSSAELPPAQQAPHTELSPADRPGAGGAKERARAAALAKAPPRVPNRCAADAAPCVPPVQWVDKLCANVYPDVALHMFAPGSPWQRIYMRKTAEPYNASGGMSRLGTKMTRGEEVIVLRRHEVRADYDMANLGGYDVLRWNGACATVHDGEYSTKVPRHVGHAPVEWRALGDSMQQKLEANPTLASVYDARRKECRGAVMGSVTDRCERYDREFTDEIVRYVREGGGLAAPDKAP